MKNNLKFYGVSLLSILFAALVTACGGSDSVDSVGGGGGGGSTYLGTQSPGDVWTWTLNDDSSFSATNSTLSHTYSGTYSTLSASGFLKLSVTATSDPGVIATPTTPVIAYAFEVPGTALIVKPAGTDSDVIVATAQGACPTVDTTYNWTVMPLAGWDSGINEAYGITNTTVTGANFDFIHELFQLDGTSISTTPDLGYTCLNGKITKTGSDVVVGLTPSGFLIGDNGPNVGGFMGMAAPAADVDISPAGFAGREFRGVLFRNGSSGDDTTLIWARPNTGSGNAQLEGGAYVNDDLETGTEAREVTVTFGTQTSPGVVNAVLTPVDGTTPAENFKVVINVINGKYFAFGISTVEGNSNQPYNMLFMEQ